jgi:hypothetical protein
VVQRVGDDRVVLAQQRLEQAAVGVEGGGVEDGVLGAQEARQALLELLVDVLRAADEAHRAHPVAVRAQRLVRRFDHLRVRGQPEVVVRAQVDQLAAVGQLHERALRRGDDALALEQARGADPVEFGLDVLVECGDAGHALRPSGRIVFNAIYVVRYIERACSIQNNDGLVKSSPQRPS